MVDQSVLDYVKENLARGYTVEQLRDYLLSQGVPPADVEAVFASLMQPYIEKPTPKPVVTSRPPVDYNEPLPHQRHHISKHDLFLILGLVVLMGFISIAAFYVWDAAEASAAAANNSTVGEIEVITKEDFKPLVHQENAVQSLRHAPSV
jgi:hypothetical protein